MAFGGSPDPDNTIIGIIKENSYCNKDPLLDNMIGGGYAIGSGNYIDV